MPTIRKNLLQLLFSGAYLLRWNDKLRPVELQEIDKQAHKMLLACALWHENSRELTAEERRALGLKIIEGGLFDYFYRCIITDIKPPVFYKIKENPEHYRQLTEYVLDRLEPVLKPLGPFWERMRSWHLDGGAEDSLDRRILTAAHLSASRWEFQIIRPSNTFDDEMASIEASFRERLGKFSDLKGMGPLLTPRTALARFANLCGQLRFQIRWTQVPRIPATSVLGHMFIVASLSYFFSLAVDACGARSLNNFFCGLFHDFPELLTRDIISPVKQSISSFPQLIKEYEGQELERRILGPLREEGFAPLAGRIAYYLGLEVGSEFRECRREGDAVVAVEDFATLHSLYNRDEDEPKDGQMLEVCDRLAALLEAHSSIRNGVSSPHLVEAQARLKSQLNYSPLEPVLHLEALLSDFD